MQDIEHYVYINLSVDMNSSKNRRDQKNCEKK